MSDKKCPSLLRIKKTMDQVKGMSTEERLVYTEKLLVETYNLLSCVDFKDEDLTDDPEPITRLEDVRTELMDVIEEYNVLSYV